MHCTPEKSAEARHLRTRPRRLARHAGARIVPVAAALLAPVVIASLLLAGCGQGQAVSNYTVHANKVLAELNAAETALRTYWAKPLSEQEDIETALANLRKSLASVQEQLDSTDSPAPARALDDTMGRAVNTCRALADLTTPYADYLAVMAPMAKQASDIVVQLQALDKSQYVPSTITNLADKSRKLEASLRTVQPNPTFQAATAQFQAFVAMMVKNLTEAEQILGAQAYVPNDSPEERTQQEEDAQSTSPEEYVSRDKQRQIDSIESKTEPIIEEWGQLDGQVNAELDEARAASGIKGKAAEVENYIGQAVAQIKELEKQYK